VILLSTSVVVKTFFRSRDRDLGLQVSRPIPIPIPIQFQLVTEHSLKGATNYRNRATGVGTKYDVLRPRPRPGSSGIEFKTETWVFRSREQDRDLGLQVSRPRPAQNELECTRVSRPWSRDHNTAQHQIDILAMCCRVIPPSFYFCSFSGVIYE